MHARESKIRTQAVPVIYLAGGMKSNWQDIVKKAIPKAIYIDPREHHSTDEAAYTQWDLAGVERADIVLGYMEKSNPGGAGLAVEFGWAARSHKYIVFAEENGYPQQKYFGMVREVSHVHVNNHNGEDALNAIIAHLQHALACNEYGQPLQH